MKDRQGNQTVSLDGQPERGDQDPDRPAGKNRLLRGLVERLADSDSAYRPTLARELGVSRQLASDLLAELERLGLVTVRGRLNGLPGRSTYSYALRAEAALALGVVLSQECLEGFLIDLRGKVIASTQVATTATVEAPALLLADLCNAAGYEIFRVRACALRRSDGGPLLLGPIASAAVLMTRALSTNEAEMDERDLASAARTMLLDVLFGEAANP